MLKYNSIIKNLSINQKIELLTSNNMRGNEILADYELPVFSVSEKTDFAFPDFRYPSMDTVARTWNDSLIRDFAASLSSDTASLEKDTLPGMSVNVDDAENAVSTEGYLDGKFAAAFMRGVNVTGAISSIFGVHRQTDEDINKYRSGDLLSAEIAVKEGKPKFVICEDDNSTEIILNEWNYEGFLSFCSDEEKSVVRGFFRKNQLLHTGLQSANEIIKNAILLYSEKKKELYEGALTKREFDSLEREGIIFDGKILDTMVDNYIGFLSEIQNVKVKQVEIDRTELLKKLAEQSIVLLKNNDDVLPVLPGTAVGVIGQEAKVDAFGNVCESDGANTVFTKISQYDLVFKGFAHGYLRETELNDMLIAEAVELAKKSEKVLLFLGTENESDTELPSTQLKLLNSLKKANVKIAAIVRGGGALDFSFADLCDAVLFVGFNSSESAKVICDMITGNITPSAKITKDLTKSVIKKEVVDETGVETEKTYRETVFPIGSGLTYNDLVYSDLRITERGVSFIAKNVGTHDARCIAYLAVKKKNGEGFFAKNRLRGYCNEKVSFKNSQKIEIPFDSYTFRYYDEEHRCFGVEGGEYELYLNIGSQEEPLCAEITLASSHEKEVFFSEFEKEFEKTNEAIDDLVNTEKHIKEKKTYAPLEAKKKTIVFSVICAYLNIIFGVAVAIMGSSVEKSNLLIIPFFSILVLWIGLDIFTALYFIVKKLKSKNKSSKHSALSLTGLVDTMTSYSESDKEVFEVPDDIFDTKPQEIETPEVEEEEEIIPDQDSIAEEIKEAEEKVKEKSDSDYIFDTSDDNVEDLTEFDNSIHIDELTASFCDYCLKCGIIIEPASARSLLAATVSTNLMFVRATDMDCLPIALNALNSFFGNEPFVQTVEGNITTYHNLIWKQNDEGMYERTDFVAFLNSAKKFKKHLNICVLDKVSIDLMKNYFSDFIQFATSPMVEHQINLGTKTRPVMYTLPQNILYILVPDDEHYLDTLPREYARVSININLNIKRAKGELKSELVDRATVSIDAVRELLKTEKNNYYFSEDDWKKFDEFESNMQLLDTKYQISNKSVLMLEKYSTFILALGADNVEASDTFIANHIVPIMKSSKLYNLNKGDAQIREALEKAFVAENLTRTLKVLKKTEK